MPTEFILPKGAPPTIPVVVIDNAGQAPALAEALLAGGVRAIEVTLRTPAGLDAIAAIAKSAPNIMLGAGTVLSPEDAQAAANAGAQFLVSPGATDSLLAAAEATGLPLLPGAITASEVMRLRERGYRRLKFFPADAAGGITALKGLAGPLPDISFCPTGGVGASNAAAYLALPTCFAVGGSWLAPTDAIRKGDWSLIEQLARDAQALA